MVVVPALPPGFLMKGRDSTGLAKFELTTLDDFTKALRLTKSRPQWDESAIYKSDSVGRLVALFPTVEEVERFCLEAKGKPLALDTETTGEQVLDCRLICCGFASANGAVLCVPFLKKGGTAYWAPHDEQRVREALKKLLSSQTTPKVIHNKSFDEIVLWSHGLPVSGPRFCCYVDSETEFLTEYGWKKYDAVHQNDRLGTIARDGSLEWQHHFNRVDSEYTGDIYTFETPHSRAVVTGNHRMLCRPFYRQRTQPIGEWEFRRADQFVGHKPDEFHVRVAVEADGGARSAGIWQDGYFIDEDFATLLGLWITDGTLAWNKGREVPYRAVWTQDIAGPAIEELRRLAPIFDLTETRHTRASPRKPKKKPAYIKMATECFFTAKTQGTQLATTLFRWCGRYSIQRRLPKFVYTMPVNIRAALLKGMLLGDSGIIYGRPVYRTMSKGLDGDVQALALTLGYAANAALASTDCFGVTLWRDRKLDHAGARLKGAGSARHNIEKRSGTERVVCFSVPNETLITRSRGRAAFYGNTMQAHHVIDAELPHSLGYCGTRHLDIRYWKDDVKGDEGWLQLDDQILRLYNLRDCLVCLRLLPIFSAELTKLKLWDLFDEEQRLASLMARATIRGLSVDFVRRDGGQELNKKTGQYELIKGLGPTLHEQMNLAFAQLQYIAGRSNFDPLKPTDVRALLYDRLTLPVVKLTPSGLPGTDKEAMTLLALAADNDWQRAAIKALADFRAAQKMLSTFVEGLPVLGDGALHVSWKLLTTSGRFASSPNAQNWSKKLKKIFKARNGFKYVGSDLSQAELRAIAYFAGDRRLLEMYSNGLNIHTVNLALSLRARPPLGHKDLDPATEQYIRQQMPLLLGPKANFSQLIEMNDNALKGARTLIKNDTFGRNYGAEEDTVFSVLRSKRDSDTNELLFPGLRRSEVEANGVMWRKLNVDIMTWWTTIQAQVKAQGHYKCPVSGRVRWFRAGHNRNEELNTPIQMCIASIMNKRMLEIQDVFDQETGGQALVVQQVHDAVNCEAPNGYEQRAAEVLNTILAQPVALPRYPQALFPPDPALVGSHLDQI